jgi:predicted transposase YbfD/YdcC
LYPAFNDIYRRHVDKAKFNVVKATAFRALKQRLTFVLHHLNERPQLGSKRRTELIQALLSVDDLRNAEQVLLKSDKDKESVKPSWFSTAMNYFTWSKGTNEESLQKEARKITSDITDSDFLRDLKGMQDKDLADPIREAMALAHSNLSSLIDDTVKKMTHAVLHMQLEECKRRVKREIETEERCALNDIRVKFIRDLNQNSAGRRIS